MESETRESLINAALKLCATEGLYCPSLRRICKAAGQKNTAAVHYHFGEREGLLRACLSHVCDHLDSHAEVDPWLPRPASQMSPLAMAVYPFCLPLLLLPRRHPEWGGAGVHFLARVMQGESDVLAQELRRVTEPGADAFVEALSPMLPHLSAQLLRARHELLLSTLFGALTGQRVWDIRPDEVRGLASLHMVMDFVMGGLSAPTT